MAVDRQELHRRIELLREKLETGKIHVASHLIEGFRNSISKVRYAKDGLVDPDSVDGRIRAMCLGIAVQHDRDEWKKAVSLKEIQQAYFARVEHNFGPLYEMMLKADASPYQFARWYSSKKEHVDNSFPEEFINELKEFWDKISDPTWIHIEDSFNLKGVFGGEIFPDGATNVASWAGIYLDTLVLPDPFLKISSIVSLMPPEEKIYQVLRIGLQVLGYKKLVLTDITPPLVAILPDKIHMEKEYHEFVIHSAGLDTLTHANRIFGHTFSEIEELKEYLSKYKSSSDLVNAIKDPRYLVFATEWEGSLEDHINRYIKEMYQKIGMITPGEAVISQLHSRFCQSNDLYHRSIDVHGVPIISAETSWLWYKWMLENSSHIQPSSNIEDLHITHALQTSVPNEITWIGDIPADALIEMRKSGAMNEIRDILRSGIKELIELNPSNFHSTGDKVFKNLDKAFTDHEVKLKELSSKKWKFAGRDIGSFLVVGGIEIAAAITGLPLYGTAAAVASMSGLIPTAKEINEKYNHISKQKDEVLNSGVGILFKHNKK
ncbi:MAG: hypothetical protein HZC49_11530 [Nitrospirae bacterium]|nr:hypothetical protein [Nitrospirota bacterium]